MENRLRYWRKLRRLSQDRLAELAGTSTQQISRLERSDRKMSLEWLARLAPVLGVAPAELLDDGALDGGPGPKEPQFIEDPAEIALVAFWRRLDHSQKKLLLGLMGDGAEAGRHAT